MDGYSLALGEPEETARALMCGQAVVGREPGVWGAGNQTRRIRLVIEGGLDARGVAALLVGTR